VAISHAVFFLSAIKKWEKSNSIQLNSDILRKESVQTQDSMVILLDKDVR
jgi:hypothetical protein